MRSEPIKTDTDRIQRDILDLSRIVDSEEQGFTRLSFSPEYRLAVDHVAALMEQEAGLTVRIDQAGNLIGRRDGKDPKAPAIMIGSHLDTVRQGGRFDGMAGVIGGLEVARALREEGISLNHPLEVVAFTAEEPSPFGISTIGSRAMCGELDEGLLENLTDPSGRTLAQALKAMGGDPHNIAKARRRPEDLLAYLELHIEQGRVLEEKGLPLGVVTGIVGITRGRVVFQGRNDHAGTTPMSARRDALAAAARAILSLEAACRARPGIVGTVGQMDLSPNSSNVVPGRVEIGLEVRGLEDEEVATVMSAFQKDLAGIRDSRGVGVEAEFWLSSPRVVFDPGMVDLVAEVCQDLNLEHIRLPSGAGHDAGHLAGLTKSAMIFIPSKGGRSHCPEEWSEFADLARGVRVLGGLVLDLDRN